MWIGDPDATMKLMFYIDERADQDQRKALEQIFTGKVGGWAGNLAASLANYVELSMPHQV